MKAFKLAQELGLERSSLFDGFRFSRIESISAKNPRSPLAGNDFFLGKGQGLPGGGPELVIDPIPTSPWPGR